MAPGASRISRARSARAAALGEALQELGMREIGRAQMKQVEMALTLQQVEHGDRAGRPVDHEGGVMLVGAGGHEAGHQYGESA